MRSPLLRLRLAIDREWIRVGWVGSPTLRHRLIAFSPTAVAIIPAMIAESYSHTFSIGIGLFGLSASALLFVFAAIRPIMLTSTRRSARLAKRERLVRNPGDEL